MGTPADAACAQGAVLVLVAHPDDETIFMGGLIGRLAATGRRVDVACATGRFGPPGLTRARLDEFAAAGLALGVGLHVLGLRDDAGPLPMRELERRLRALDATSYDTVHTHGVFGEYGHRHHRDVCLAAHRVFGPRTVCLAGPLAAELHCELAPGELERKRSIAATSYRSQPGIAAWCSLEERYARVAPEVAECLVGLANGVLDRRIIGLGRDPDLRARLEGCHRALLAHDAPYPELAGVPEALWRPNARRFAALAGALIRLWKNA